METKSVLNSLRDPLLSNESSSQAPNQITKFHLLSQFITRLARRIANIFFSIGSFLRRIFSFNFSNRDEKYSISLTPLQEERLQKLRHRLEIPFDTSSIEHQDALKQLWKLAYPNREIPALKSDKWKEMGWQGSDPSTDFRGGGFISLENLIYFAKTYPDSFQRLLHKKDGERSKWEYPFAAAGINISFMLAQMLDFQSGKPRTEVGIRFLDLLGEDEMAFDRLYCVVFQILDSEWLAKKATYMEFNEVMKATRVQLEQELRRNGISSVRDMNAYKMLK
ncbi:hypothetical protein LUZ60_010955 [Juncus effusus]|nr:hypothetical protein LUZ60_010955 [Juncus effusus]